MEKFFALIILSIFVEAIITYLRELFPILPPLGLSIGIGILSAVLYNVDAPALLGLVSPVPYVGAVMTGFVVARGSNYAYDLIGRFTNLDFKPLEPIEGVAIDDNIKEYNP